MNTRRRADRAVDRHVAAPHPGRRSVGRVAATTVGWLALLFAGLAVVIWQAFEPPSRHAESEHEAAQVPLVSVADSAWSSVELFTASGVQRLERDAAGQWLLHAERAGEPARHAHAAEPVAAERIATVLGTFSRARVERRLAGPESQQLAAFGLERPWLIVIVRGADERPVLTLEVGELAPDGLSRYVRLPRDGALVTIPDFQVQGLLGLIERGSAAASSSAPSAGLSGVPAAGR